MPPRKKIATSTSPAGPIFGRKTSRSAVGHGVSGFLSMLSYFAGNIGSSCVPLASNVCQCRITGYLCFKLAEWGCPVAQECASHERLALNTIGTAETSIEEPGTAKVVVRLRPSQGPVGGRVRRGLRDRRHLAASAAAFRKPAANVSAYRLRALHARKAPRLIQVSPIFVAGQVDGECHRTKSPADQKFGPTRRIAVRMQPAKTAVGPLFRDKGMISRAEVRVPSIRMRGNRKLKRSLENSGVIRCWSIEASEGTSRNSSLRNQFANDLSDVALRLQEVHSPVDLVQLASAHGPGNRSQSFPAMCRAVNG